MHVVVTGGAGFIGSHVADALVARGDHVVVVDNLSTGRLEHLSGFLDHPRGRLERLDLFAEPERLVDACAGVDAVIHLAANADVRFGWDHPRRDLEQNVIATHHVLEAVRRNDVGRVLFSSTGSVYGEAPVIPTPEDAPFPVQTSLYGASKLAAEGFFAAYAEGCGVSTTVFRFVSVMGARYTHGHVIDFVRQLEADPGRLRILGDGNQRKSYLEVGDCVAAILDRLDARPGYEVVNLGTDEYCTVRDSASWICARLGLEPEWEFTGGQRGWVGDNPFIFLDTTRMRSLGWQPRYTIRQAVERTVDYLVGASASSAPGG
jgi:UDP-glucose 4-epimerase